MDIDKITTELVPQLQRLANKFDVDTSERISEIDKIIESYYFRARMASPFVRVKNRLTSLITGRPEQKVVLPKLRMPYAPEKQNLKYSQSLETLAQLIKDASWHAKNYYSDLLGTDIAKIIQLLTTNENLLKYQQPRDLLYPLIESLITEAITSLRTYKSISNKIIRLFLAFVKETGLVDDSRIIEQALRYVEALAKEIEYCINNYRSLVPKVLDEFRNFVVAMGLSQNSQTLNYVIKFIELIAKNAIDYVNKESLSIADSFLVIFVENVRFHNLKNSKEILIIVDSINSAFDNKIG